MVDWFDAEMDVLVSGMDLILRLVTHPMSERIQAINI